ncbi:DUF1330 domain-containing protein [Actinomadura sp. 1N219]|uniref:DUF1330 domain-containing protein n=1 Tax=Actinomadura sp. 1N219 TaxID=3375152 RepID=UPI0037927BB7
MPADAHPRPIRSQPQPVDRTVRLGQRLPHHCGHREAGCLQQAGRSSRRGRGGAAARPRQPGRRTRRPGIAERTVLVEFDSFEQAVAAHASAAYQEALAALADGVECDFRIIESLD